MKLDMRKKQEKKETTKSTKKLPMTAKMKRAMAVYIAMVLIRLCTPNSTRLRLTNNFRTLVFAGILPCKRQGRI